MRQRKLAAVSAALMIPASALSLTTAVHAETTAERPEPAALEEILVTAQKRSESMQEVPFSISALPASSLDEMRVVDYASLARSVPGFAIQEDGFGRNQFTIRGVTTDFVPRDSPVFKEKVGVYLDEMPVADSLYTPRIDFFDLERVEVLRGPQGTLFGAGSLAGTVRIITREPSLTDREAAVQVGVATTAASSASYNARLLVSGPVVDGKLAVRLVAGYEDDGGFIDNVGLDAHDVNESTHRLARLKALYAVNDDLQLKFAGYYDKLEVGGASQEDADAYPRGLVAGPGAYEQYRQVSEPQRDELKAGSVELHYGFAKVDLLAVSSYIDGTAFRQTDESPYMDSPFIFDQPQLLFWSEDNNSYRVQSHELRFTSHGVKPLRWVAGLFYSQRDREILQVGPSPGFDAAFGISSPALGAPVDYTFTYNQRLRLRQYAVFGEARYEFTDQFAVAAGLRWFNAEETLHEEDGGFFFGGPQTVLGDFREDGFNPRFIVEYRPAEHVLLSAQASRGFRLGGFTYPVNETLCAEDLAELGLSEPPNQFNSEHLWNYELGAKTTWLGDRLTINGSVFRIEYKDLQQSIRLDCSFSLAVNLGAARSTGVELEMNAAVTDRLSLRVAGSYTNAEVTDAAGSLVGEVGYRMPLSPKVALAVSGRYERPITAAWNGFMDLAFQHTDSRVQNLADQDFLAKSYDLASLQLGLRHEKTQLILHVDNIFNEKAELARQIYLPGLAADGGNARDTIVRNRPRTIGLTLRKDF